MKRKKIGLVGYCLILCFILALNTSMAGCSLETTSEKTSKVVTTSTLTSITILPSSPAPLTVGSTQPFTATGTYADGSTADITFQVIWASSDTATAGISVIGVSDGKEAGITNITAALSGIPSPPVTLTVAAPTAVVATFTGNADETTGQFGVYTQWWTVSWSYTTSSTQKPTFDIYTYPVSEPAPVVNIVDAKSTGSTICYSGPGEYYFRINSANIDSWTITVSRN